VTLFSLFFAVSSFAAKKVTTGFVQLSPGHDLYIEYKPAENGLPTLVVLNGLTYNVRTWDPFIEPFLKSGYGILRYDAQGQGETLLQYAPAMREIPLSDQTSDLHALLAKLNLTESVYLLGLSYGGGIALDFLDKYPAQVKALILMAPYTEPLKQQNDWIMSQVWYTRATMPFNQATDDELYDYYLKTLVYTTYPVAEPVVLNNPFILEAVYRMAEGVRKFNAVPLEARFPQASVHLIQGSADQYITSVVFDSFWNQLPQGAGASRIIIEGSEHKIPQAVPKFSQAWVEKILAGDKRISGGRQFKGEPLFGRAKSEQTVVNLPKDI
jgi:pimeloyl-ACP methyl ester carboxylesterase